MLRVCLCEEESQICHLLFANFQKMAFISIKKAPSHEILEVPLNDEGHLPKAQVTAIDSRATGLTYRMPNGYV